MHSNLTFNRITLLVLFAVWVIASSPAVGQVVEPSPEQTNQQEEQKSELPASAGEAREFRDELGAVIVTGHFVQLKGNRVIILNAEGVETKVLRNSLSKNDQAWIVAEVELRRVHAIAQKKLDKIQVDFLQSLKETKVVNGLNRIARLEKDAPFATSVVNEYLTKPNPVAVRAAAFAACVAVTPANEANLQKVFATMIKDANEINAHLIEQPQGLIVAISTFGEMSWPYLKSVAYSGNVIPVDPIVVPAEPSTDLTKQQIPARVAAIEALAALAANNVNRDETLQAVLVLLSTVETSDADDNETDDAQSTIRACLAAIGRTEISNDEVTKQLDRYSTNLDYAKQVERVRAKLERAQESEK